LIGLVYWRAHLEKLAKAAGKSGSSIPPDLITPILQAVSGVGIGFAIICGTEFYLSACHAWLGDIGTRSSSEYCPFESPLLRAIMLARRSKDWIGDLGIFAIALGIVLSGALRIFGKRTPYPAVRFLAGPTAAFLNPICTTLFALSLFSFWPVLDGGTGSFAAAKKAGLRILGIRPDGTVIVYDGKRPIEEALRSALGCEAEAPARSPWDEVSASDQWKERQEARQSGSVVAPDEVPLTGEAWRERVDKWKEWVRGRPLGVLEKRALRDLSAIKGQPPRHIKGAGPGTMDKLEARGFVKTAGEMKSGYFPMYKITTEGEAEWLKVGENDAS
jgi:hypothetical protein